MSAIDLSLIAFACVFGAALLGFLLHLRIPVGHQSEATRKVVELSMGLVATMTALVLGFLVASAKAAYDVKKDETTQMTARILFLDRELANYGHETAASRQLLHRIVEKMIGKLWPEPGAPPQPDEPTGFRSAQLYDALESLVPQNDLQRAVKVHAVNDAVELSQTRWLLYEQSGSSIPTSILIIVIAWLALLFLSFALFGPRNATVLIALFLAALSVCGGLLLILELDRPFRGVIKISSAPMREMLNTIGR